MVTDNGLVGDDVLEELFPVGMHVLAVDDNRVCLSMLENMLLKCHYKVTTTTESVKALEMLRENKDMFDLVICDVNMPEMDGFKLLKQVGQLEMDLPFIMLSGHGDTESVMKGVTNGASDYILKPIRMEEVKTIWQHVVRKKINGKYQRKVSGANNVEKQVSGDNSVEIKVSGVNNVEKQVSGDNNVEKKVPSGDNNEEKIANVARVCSQDTTSDQNVAGKDQILGQKRKDRSESEEDNDTDGSTEKKPRFVWDTELHNKFVVAVKKLGFDKAYPKKILELMNVEGLTRENVASHLQKFRLSLKRSDKQHSRTDATLDSTSPYLHMGSVGGRRFNNTLPSSYASPSYGSGQLVSQVNTPSGLNFRRMSYGSMPLFQSRNNINCFHMPVVSANERPCFVLDFRTSIGMNQYQQNNYLTGNMKLSSIEDPKAFTGSSSFQGAVNNASSSFLSCIPSNHHPLTYNANSNSLSCIPSNHSLTNANRRSFFCIPSNQPLTHNLEAFTNHSSVGSAYVKKQSPNNTLDSVIMKTQSLNNTLGSVGVADMITESQSMINPLDSVGVEDMKTESQPMINPLDSVGGEDMKTESQPMINPLDSVGGASLAQPYSQLITMPETVKFYTDPEAMGSNDDCFYNQMLSLHPGFLDNSFVSLDDIY